MKFLTGLHTKPYGDEHILTAELIYLTKAADLVRVEKGFITDFYTTGVFRHFVDIHSKHNRAAVVHDSLYKKFGMNGGKFWTRKECDEIFLEAMETSGMSYKRYLIYWAVRVYWTFKGQSEQWH